MLYTFNLQNIIVNYNLIKLEKLTIQCLWSFPAESVVWVPQIKSELYSSNGIALRSVVYTLLYFCCVKNMCSFHECGIINILMWFWV